MEQLRQKQIYPKPPLNPKILEQTEDSLTMSWDNKGNYNIYLDGNKIDTIKNTFYTFTGLEPNKEYQLCVAPVSSMGEGEKVCLTGKTKVKIEEVVVIPKRVDIDTGETQQMTIKTLPPEALEQYSYKIEPVLDNSIVKFDGDKVSGVKSVNDERLGRNYIVNSKSFKKGEVGVNSNISSEILKNGDLHIFKKNGLESKDWFVNFLANFDDTKTALLELEDNTSITFCLWIKGEGEVPKAYIYEGGSYQYPSNKNEQLKYDKYTCYKYTFSHNYDSFNMFGLMLDGKNSDIFVEKCMLTVDPNKNWTPAPEDGYSYTSANVTFNDDEKSSAEFDIFVHEPKTQESLTEPEIVNNTL